MQVESRMLLQKNPHGKVENYWYNDKKISLYLSTFGDDFVWCKDKQTTGLISCFVFTKVFSSNVDNDLLLFDLAFILLFCLGYNIFVIKSNLCFSNRLI